MTILTWDQSGQRLYETGVDRGVLYIPNAVSGLYDNGVAWNGLVSVTESPSGAESSAQYADNSKYLNLVSAEEFGATLEAFTYPTEFNQFDGLAIPQTGVTVGQQNRGVFGLSYRTLLGNDILGTSYGYKLHLVYGLTAAPSEKAYSTVNDSPEAITFSWELSSVPVAVTGLKPTSIITINSTEVAPSDLAELEQYLYGTVGTDPSLPMPDTVIALFAGAQTVVTPTAPTFVAGTGVITIPTVTGVTYRRADTNAIVTGTVTIGTAGATLVIRAYPASNSYIFSPTADDDWSFKRD
jgi:hypothetical protein